MAAQPSTQKTESTNTTAVFEKVALMECSSHRGRLLIQPDDNKTDKLCFKAASSMIVHGVYPDNDDNAFIEASSITSQNLSTGLQALSQAQDTVKLKKIPRYQTT